MIVIEKRFDPLGYHLFLLTVSGNFVTGTLRKKRKKMFEKRTWKCLFKYFDGDFLKLQGLLQLKTQLFPVFVLCSEIQESFKQILEQNDSKFLTAQKFDQNTFIVSGKTSLNSKQIFVHSNIVLYFWEQRFMKISVHSISKHK